MRDFDSLNFDLDGTLWNTYEACAIAWNNIFRNRRNMLPKLFQNLYYNGTPIQ